MGGLRSWLAWHSVKAHLTAPLWARIPEKTRWRIVGLLKRSKRTCWSSLVDAAMCNPERDACDIRTPLGCGAGLCPTRCDWSHPDHFGEHDCNCYCGKFRFTAPEGAVNRLARQEPTP